MSYTFMKVNRTNNDYCHRHLLNCLVSTTNCPNSQPTTCIQN